MNNEIYHYGVPGMKWGKRKSVTTTRKQSKPKLSKGKKIAIGVTAASATLAVIGAKPISKFAGNVRAGFAVSKALMANM